MHSVILWCGFLGAWLLVAGPLHQAAVELDEESFSREEIQAAATSSAADTPRPSAWWWLLPPVGYWLQRRYARAQRERMMSRLSDDTMRDLLSYTNKATGWFYVAGGASLIAVKETWELAEDQDWPAWVFWGLIVLMVAVAAVNTAVRMRRTHHLVGTDQPRRTDSVES